jgi:hypothetical protein
VTQQGASICANIIDEILSAAEESNAHFVDYPAEKVLQFA